MASSGHRVEFAGRTLDRSRHICAFFNSADEERRVLRSFNKDGIERGRKRSSSSSLDKNARATIGSHDSGTLNCQ